MKTFYKTYGLQTSSRPFALIEAKSNLLFTEDSLKSKRTCNSFQAIFLAEFSHPKCSSVILHKLAKFNYHTAFSSKFVQ